MEEVIADGQSITYGQFLQTLKRLQMTTLPVNDMSYESSELST